MSLAKERGGEEGQERSISSPKTDPNLPPDYGHVSPFGRVTWSVLRRGLGSFPKCTRPLAGRYWSKHSTFAEVGYRVREHAQP